MSAREGTAADGRLLLTAAIASFSGTPFAVVDGGLFEDLPSLFKRGRLFARSLYLESADEAVQRAGPLLVDLSQAPEATTFVLGLPAKKPFAVFWSCAAGEAVLHRHLRSLNMARVPEWATAQMPRPPDATAHERYQTVFFRHYDPRVLNALVPCLDAAQFARIVGPAEEIAYLAQTRRVRRILADRQWPPAPGLLTVRGDQYEAMVGRLEVASEQRLVAYLRTYAPGHVRHLDDDALLTEVRRYGREASGMGACNENAIGLWSYMQATSRMNLSHDEPVKRFMADPSCGADANERMEALFELRTRLLRKVHG